MEIRTYLREQGYPKGWESVFRETREDRKMATRYLRDNEIDYCPNAEDVFRIYFNIEPKDVKVVIMGQDPYHDGKADGFAFSTRDFKPMHSVKNLMQEALNDLPVNRLPVNGLPETGDLISWVKQGVMLLNVSLTAKRGKANDHPNIWIGMLEATIVYLTNLNKKIIWVLLGKEAEKQSSKIGSKGIKLFYPHPSPINTGKPFLGCGMFSDINKELVKLKKEPIAFHKF